MTAEEIAKALGGRKVGGTWMACCPVHDDRTPSFSVKEASDGKVLVHCYVGCGQAEVVQALRQRGLWPNIRYPGKIRPQSRKYARKQRVGESADRTAAALRIWQSAAPAANTVVETYFRSRGINVTPPASLRFLPALQHPSGGLWPCMVALVTDGVEGTPLAVLRTYLLRNGAGKAPVNPAKMMLGQCRGGVVRLAQPGALLMIGEGIETCFSAMQATGHPAWAALSTSGLRALGLPTNVRDVIILADGDEPGEAAARACARRWKREGRRVRIARPPSGMDFNDMLMAFRSGTAFANSDAGKAKVTASAKDGSSSRGDLSWR